LEIEDFFSIRVFHALRELKEKLEKRGKEIIIENEEKYAKIIIKDEGKMEFGFEIITSWSLKTEYPICYALYPKENGTVSAELHSFEPEVYGHEIDISKITKDKIIQDILDIYDTYIKLIKGE
jgi:hypothetical protein